MGIKFIIKSKPVDEKLEYFKRLVIEHLKSLDSGDSDMEKGRAYDVGTIRERRGGTKWIKGADKKWRLYYNKESRGAKISISNLIKKVNSIDNVEDLMKLILLHRDRFSDDSGNPIPLVQELSRHISERQGRIAPQKTGEENKDPEKPVAPEEKKPVAGEAKEERIAIVNDIVGKVETTRFTHEQGVKELMKKLGMSKESAEAVLDTYHYLPLPKGGAGGKPRDKKSGKWENPLQKYDNLDPGTIARTVVNFDKKNLTEDRVVSAMVKKYGLSEEDAKGFWNYLNALTPTEVKKAKLFADDKALSGMVDQNKAEYPDLEKWAKSYESAKDKDEQVEFNKPRTYRGEKQIELKNPPGLDAHYYLKESIYGDRGTPWALVREQRPTADSSFKLASKDSLFFGDLKTCKELLRRLAIGAKAYNEKQQNTGQAEGPEESEEEKHRNPSGFEIGKLADSLYSRFNVDLSWGRKIINDILQGKPYDELVKYYTGMEPGHPHPKDLQAIYEQIINNFGLEHKNRSQAMMGNQNAKKDGVTDEPESEKKRKTEQSREKKARKKAGMPPEERGERVSAMKDSTWDPKSNDYRYKDTGYIAGSRKERAQAYIRRMAKEGVQVVNSQIDWESIEENDRTAKEIITKQNLMGKPDWEALKNGGMTGGAGYLVNEIYRTISSKPRNDTPEDRNNFSLGLDSVRGRFEACKQFSDVQKAAQEIFGEMTGRFVDSLKTPEYLELAKKLETQKEKLSKYNSVLKEKIYEAGDPFTEAKQFLAADLGISGNRLIDEETGDWNSSYYPRGHQKRQRELFKKGSEEYKRRQKQIEDRTGITRESLKEAIWETEKNMVDVRDKKNEELRLTNTMSPVWYSLGDSFASALKITAGGSKHRHKEAFAKHYDKVAELGINDDDFSWAEARKGGRGGEKRKTQFELQVADHIVRKGGRDIQVESTEELKKMFNLRDVQSGNWVLNDVKSAKFHVDNIAMGLADLADITGIPDNLVSLNGRLAIAIGARGHSKWLAHYESLERVINITKMRGGGSLGHEWFHAFDNLIAEAMTGGKYNVFLTETNDILDLSKTQSKLLDRVRMYKRWRDEEKEGSDSYRRYNDYYEEAKKAAKKAGISVDEIESGEEHIQKIKTAFDKLVKAMKTGDTIKTKDVSYTKADYIKLNDVMSRNPSFISGIGITDDMPVGEAIKQASRWRKYYGFNRGQLTRAVAAHYDKNPNGGAITVNTDDKTSAFYEAAKKLDGSGSSPYWSKIIEMGARAFSAYLNDKMAERGWTNNYLAHATDNNAYSNGQDPYPVGEERKAINTAFDELFQAIKETGAIRKAINMVDSKTKLFMDIRFVLPIRKSIFNKGKVEERAEKVLFLENIRKKILDHLSSLEEEENSGIKKSILGLESLTKGGVPPGTRHTWSNGVTHVKLPSGKWRPVYDSQTRGAKMAISALKKKIDNAKDVKEIMDIVMENRERFSDAQGHPLPLVQELSDYVNEAQDKKAAVDIGKPGKKGESLERYKNYKKGTFKKPKGKWSSGDLLMLNGMINRLKESGYQTKVKKGNDKRFQYKTIGSLDVMFENTSDYNGIVGIMNAFEDAGGEVNLTDDKVIFTIPEKPGEYEQDTMEKIRKDYRDKKIGIEEAKKRIRNTGMFTNIAMGKIDFSEIGEHKGYRISVLVDTQFAGIRSHFYTIESKADRYDIKEGYDNHVSGHIDYTDSWYPKTKEDASQKLKELLDNTVKIDHIDHYDHSDYFREGSSGADEEVKKAVSDVLAEVLESPA
jgi:hypothetical protein